MTRTATAATLTLATLLAALALALHAWPNVIIGP